MGSAAGSWTPPPGPWTPPTAPPADPAASARTHRRRVSLVITATIAVIALLAGLGIGVGVHSFSPSNVVAGRATPANPVTPSPSIPQYSGGNGSSSSGSSSTPATDPSANAVSKIEAGTVDINTTLGYQSAKAAGTGMVISSNGTVLTNNHVVDGSTSISATVVGNGHTYTAKLVGTDPTADVAVIQLVGASGLTTIQTADSAKVAVGDPIIALGNAGGKGGSPSVVTGSVQAVNQEITASDQNGSNAEKLTGLIQIDAPIVPGDSGGPLANSDGQVIGMDTAASATNQFTSQTDSNVGFAIPIRTAMTIAGEITAGHASNTIHIGLGGFLGVEIAPASTDQGGFGSGSSGPASSDLTVAGVVPGSPAERAGIQTGDTITAFAGQSVATQAELSALTHRHHAGDQVSVSWTDQSGQSHTAKVTLITGPAD